MYILYGRIQISPTDIIRIAFTVAWNSRPSDSALLFYIWHFQSGRIKAGTEGLWERRLTLIVLSQVKVDHADFHICARQPRKM